jgi:hypothetical protein
MDKSNEGGHMTEDKTSAVDIETARREKALLGYEMAITLWIFQGQQRWARFNVTIAHSGTESS